MFGIMVNLFLVDIIGIFLLEKLKRYKNLFASTETFFFCITFLFG